MNPLQAAAAGPLPGERPRVLLGVQTPGSLLRNIVHIYRRHWLLVLSCSVLPVLPWIVVVDLVGDTSLVISGIALIGYFSALFIGPAALTVLISDICVGNTPRASRAFARVLGGRRWWWLFTTGMLMGLAVIIGLLLFIVPGLWLFVRGLFGATIVALEGRRNADAIRRSFELTRGQAWRLTGLTLLPIIVAYLVLVVLLLVLFVIVGLIGGDSAFMQRAAAIAAIALMLGLMLPVAGITAVLLYYDQRVRREAYDAQALSEDLMR